MNCQIFETVVNDLAREQMMEANVREDALAHSDVCEACALRLSLERRLTSGLRALAVEMRSRSASARVEEHLLEAFRSQASSPSQTRLAKRRRYWPAAAAAAVLIAFGIGGIRWRFESRSLPVIQTSNNNGVQTPSKTSIVAMANPNTGPAPKPTPAWHRPRRKQSVRDSKQRPSVGNETSVAKAQPLETNTTEVGSSEDSEVTTQFLPLSYASPVNLQDGGQLVRVELPRSAMLRFGLPVNMERYGEKVKADVFVSADGLARAIRFVQ